MVVWFNGEYVAKEKVAVSPDDRGFLFGDGVYEVIRSYQGRLFKFAEHLQRLATDRKSTRLNSSHSQISYAVFCLKKKKIYHIIPTPTLNRLLTVPE